MIKELGRFTALEKVVWCQEEPKNMGSWYFIQPRIERVLEKMASPVKRPVYAGRKSSASTATGLMSRHLKQQEELVAAALDC